VDSSGNSQGTGRLERQDAEGSRVPRWGDRQRRRYGLPCVAHRALAVSARSMVTKAQDAVEADLLRLRRRCYRGLIAQGDGLAKFADAGMNSNAEDGMSTVSETSEGSGGTSRRSSRSARTSRTARSARDKTPVDDLLVELVSRSYKNVCRIARETDTVGDIGGSHRPILGCQAGRLVCPGRQIFLARVPKLRCWGSYWRRGVD
jgi:hypothetical protein